MKKKMHLAWFSATGPGGSAGDWKNTTDGHDWRYPEIYQDIARACERGKFDMVFFADQLAMPQVYEGKWDYYLKKGLWAPVHDPLPIISMMAAVTTRIGLVSTLSTTFYPPFLLARLLSTLDHLSRGRVGWNMVTAVHKLAAQNFGLDDLPEHDDRYDLADEYVALCRALWDSWEPDALVLDRENDVFADPAKVHFTNFEGKHYRSRGPLPLPASPQGHPVMISAGASPRGRRFAAQHAEVTISSHTSIKSMKTYADDLRAKTSDAGRDPYACKFFTSIKPIFGETESIAREKWEQQAAAANYETGLASLSETMQVDFSKFPLDEPLPPDLKISGMQSRMALYYQDSTPTLRQIAEHEARHEAFPIVGTAEQIADRLEQCLIEGDADGFYIRPGLQNVAYLIEFIDKVVPVLQRRGLLRKDYEGTTLRDHLAQN